MNKPALFNTVALIGLGLMGGSLAKSIKKHGLAKKITGFVPNPKTIETALAKNIIDEARDSIETLAEDADIIILCSPLSTYPDIAASLANSLKENTIVTDIGSVKQYVIDTFSSHLSPAQQINLIPGHPIAGSEKTGIEHSVDDLFEGRKTILTPTSTSDNVKAMLVETLWQSIGSEVEILDAKLHDTIYANVSHVVQKLLFHYSDFLKEQNIAVKEDTHPAVTRFFRLTHSNPIMWEDIFTLNADAIETAWQHHKAALHTLLEHLNSQDKEALTSWLKDAKRKREPLTHNSLSPLSSTDLSLWNQTFPLIIAGALLHICDFAEYSGTGFKDVTEIMLCADEETLVTTILTNHSEISTALQDWIAST